MFLLYGMLGSPSQCASPLQCSPHWCFRAEASGVLPIAHHKFLSHQQEQQLEYFSEAASALRYICYFGGGEGEGQLILKCNLLPPGVHWELLTWVCGISVFLGFSCPCFPCISLEDLPHKPLKYCSLLGSEGIFVKCHLLIRQVKTLMFFHCFCGRLTQASN